LEPDNAGIADIRNPYGDLHDGQGFANSVFQRSEQLNLRTDKDLGCGIDSVDQAIKQLNRPSSLISCPRTRVGEFEAINLCGARLTS